MSEGEDLRGESKPGPSTHRPSFLRARRDPAPRECADDLLLVEFGGDHEPGYGGAGYG
jgi:hypothetical protein